MDFREAPALLCGRQIRNDSVDCVGVLEKGLVPLLLTNEQSAHGAPRENLFLGRGDLTGGAVCIPAEAAH